MEWWREWSSPKSAVGAQTSRRVKRSAEVLKALSYAPTGAIVAAPTTSLPEARDLSGERNWDYRFSWIRDAALAAHSLAELGHVERGRRVPPLRRAQRRRATPPISRSCSASKASGVLAEEGSVTSSGYRGSAPARSGNAAADQFQLDAYGQLLDQSWSWHRHGNSPDDDYWRFLSDLVDAACERWEEPDRGIWEWRGEPRHFVHSKALAGRRSTADPDRRRHRARGAGASWPAGPR